MVLPHIRGLYLAERVDVDPVTRDLTLVNCFRGMRMKRLPGSARPFSVVAYLANGVGDFDVAVVIERMDTFDEVRLIQTRLSPPDRMTEVRFKLRIENCVLPVEGEYSVSLWIGGELLAQTPFYVRLTPEVN